MKFDQHLPTEKLRAYIKYYVVTENATENEYKVFPPTGLVIGFQYQGQLSEMTQQGENQLSAAGVTGLSDHCKLFKNSANIGTILVYFTETGFSHFSKQPVHELFNLSVSLEALFDPSTVNEVEEKLAAVLTDKDRVKVVEQFLLTQLKNIESDHLIVEAVRRIYHSKGSLRIKALSEGLLISQSPFEKRFRKIVGTTPKKFASIVRFHAVLTELQSAKSLTDICYENNFFDQAHFIKDFKHYTGTSPENFKRTQ